MEYKKKIDDLLEYAKEHAITSNCTIGYTEIIDQTSLIVVLDNPGIWIFEYGIPVFTGGGARMLLYKIENNKFTIKSFFQLDRSKYHSDFKYVTNCKNKLLKSEKEKQSKKQSKK